VDPQTLVLLLGALVPLLVALATKRYAQPWVKVATNVVAAALVASLAHLATASGHYDLPGFWRAFLEALVASGVSYEVLLKNTAVRAIESSTGHWGLGAVTLTPIVPSGLAVDGHGVVVVPAALPAGPLPAPEETPGD
jgi:hypothetical protein